MTHDSNIEGVLDRWLTEGPTQMPSRFLADTLDRIDRTPQPRLAGLRTRLPLVHPTLRFAVAAAVVLTVVGLGASVITQIGGVGSPLAGSGPLPASLQAEWSPVLTRQYPFLHGTTEGGGSDLDIIIGQTSITIFEPHLDVYNSASAVGADRIELRALNTGAYSDCRVGDPGTYTFSLSPEGRTLTLTPISDACAERATILAGDWTRTDIGNLAPGRHVSANFGPFGDNAGGTLSYAVPSGWADIDLGLSFSILPRSNARDQANIRLWMDVVAESQDVACAPTRPGPSRSPAAVATWLATLPGLVVTPPSAVSIGGLDGVIVDLSLVRGWTSRCGQGPTVGPGSPVSPREGGAFVSTFSASGVDHPVLTVDAERRVRYVLLDRGDGSTLVIEIEAPNVATWDATVADAMSIVQSFEFTR